jgi:hypothetical protein
MGRSLNIVFVCVYMRYLILAANHLCHTKLGVLVWRHPTGSGSKEASGARSDKSIVVGVLEV